MIETVEFRTPSARCRALQDAPTPPLPVAVPPTCNFWIVICETYSKRFCLGNQPLENQRWILAHFLEGYWKLAGWLAGCWKLAVRRRREKIPVPCSEPVAEEHPRTKSTAMYHVQNQVIEHISITYTRPTISKYLDLFTPSSPAPSSPAQDGFLIHTHPDCPQRSSLMRARAPAAATTPCRHSWRGKARSPPCLRGAWCPLLVSQAKSIGTLRDATPHAPPAIRRLHTYALSVVAVVAQLPLSSSAALATTPSFSTRLASFSASLRPPSSELQTFCIYPGVF